MTATRQFVSCKYRIADTRTFTFHNDGPPVADGNIVLIAGKGDAAKKVFVVSVTDEAPEFDTKPILGLHVEEQPAPDPLFTAAAAALG